MDGELVFFLMTRLAALFPSERAYSAGLVTRGLRMARLEIYRMQRGSGFIHACIGMAA